MLQPVLLQCALSIAKSSRPCTPFPNYWGVLGEGLPFHPWISPGSGCPITKFCCNAGASSAPQQRHRRHAGRNETWAVARRQRRGASCDPDGPFASKWQCDGNLVGPAVLRVAIILQRQGGGLAGDGASVSTTVIAEASIRARVALAAALGTGQRGRGGSRRRIGPRTVHFATFVAPGLVSPFRAVPVVVGSGIACLHART